MPQSYTLQQAQLQYQIILVHPKREDDDMNIQVPSPAVLCIQLQSLGRIPFHQPQRAVRGRLSRARFIRQIGNFPVSRDLDYH
jgi:hypothetical protein